MTSRSAHLLLQRGGAHRHALVACTERSDEFPINQRRGSSGGPRVSDAADVVQDVFARAWTRLDAVRDPAAFPGWLMTLARHRAIDRARLRPPPSDTTVEVAVAPVPTAEAAAALRAIRALPEAYRETLLMRLVEGLTGPEIAERTGLTPESVRVNLHRGMKLLRERLDGGSP